MELQPAKIAAIGIAALLVLSVGLVAAAYFVGASSIIEPSAPEKGIEAIDVPFSGYGQDYVPIKWSVNGATGSPVLSAIYFGPEGSATDFSKSPPPDQTGYHGFVPYKIEEAGGKEIFVAYVPNAYEQAHVRIYAQIDGRHYWSDEYVVYP